VLFVWVEEDGVGFVFGGVWAAECVGVVVHEVFFVAEGAIVPVVVFFVGLSECVGLFSGFGGHVFLVWFVVLKAWWFEIGGFIVFWFVCVSIYGECLCGVIRWRRVISRRVGGGRTRWLVRSIVGSIGIRLRLFLVCLLGGFVGVLNLCGGEWYDGG
jgi:hypothetical protein